MASNKAFRVGPIALTKNAGVYRISNRVDGKQYIGGSLLVLRRLGHHRSLLRRQLHFNRHLQRAWDKHGEDAFVFEVVQFCDKDDVLFCEQTHLDEMFATVDRRLIYNTATVAAAPMTGLKASDETRRKMSDALRGKRRCEATKERMRKAQRGRVVSDEGRRNVSMSKSGANHPNWGKSMPEVVREKISAAQKGRVFTEEHLRNLRNAARTRRRKAQGES